MKRVLVLLLVVGLVLVVQSEILARGGGGGGRGGGGGGFSGGGGGARAGGGFSPAPAPRPAARPAAPSVSRPATPNVARPNPGGPGVRPGNTPNIGSKPGVGSNVPGSRPSASQLNNFLDLPNAGPGPGPGGVAGGTRPGGAAADFLQGGASQLPAAGNRPAIGNNTPGGVRPGTDVGRPGTPGQNLSQNRPGRIENRGERQNNRNERRDEILKQCDEHHFGDFWEEYPGWSVWAITRPFAWATWGSVGSWCGYSGDPTGYAYGETVYYGEDGQVYYGEQPVATAEEYVQQAADIAATDPASAPQKGDWLPLGVFAITQDGQASGAEPSLFLQLVISKQGVINGTFKNTLTGKTQPLEGMADKKSQRVAWVVTGQQAPIMETGLSNLTKDTAPALIHFADGQTQQWLMVRLPEPKQ